MPSELARSIGRRLKLGAVGVTMIDGSLQEVREVMVITSRHKDANGLPCWCAVMMRTMPHMEDCQRARTLFDRLRVDGGKGE
jgi:hypothetical protein